MPIEPPGQRTNGESYARRQHQFLKRRSTLKPGGISFGRKKSSISAPEDLSQDDTPARFSADIRLPNPSIIVCNQVVPLKILIKRLSTASEQLYLQSLQIELVGYTVIRAQVLKRNESGSWIVFSRSNMATPIGSPSDPEGTETFLPRDLWMSSPLPNTVAPSFHTCNISRRYELQVSVGLGYATHEHGKVLSVPYRSSASILYLG